MRQEFKLVDTSTRAGIEQAERLKAAGWIIYRTGLFLLWFRRGA